MRAKKPGGVHAGPSCIAQYGKGDVGPQILRRRRGFGGDVSRAVARGGRDRARAFRGFAAIRGKMRELRVRDPGRALDRGGAGHALVREGGHRAGIQREVTLHGEVVGERHRSRWRGGGCNRMGA